MSIKSRLDACSTLAKNMAVLFGYTASIPDNATKEERLRFIENIEEGLHTHGDTMCDHEFYDIVFKTWDRSRFSRDQLDFFAQVTVCQKNHAKA